MTMLKYRTTMRWLLCLLILLSAPSAAFSAGAGDLKILISIDQPTVVAPFPAQVSLHLHNSGTQPLLIYTPVRDASVVSGAINPFISDQPGPGSTSGGSALAVHLIPLKGADPDETAQGRVLEIAGFPHPKLLTLGPGEDFEERAALQLSPALEDQNSAKLLWGSYKLSVTYTASYSNGDNLNRILGADIWQGKIESNSVGVDLRPPPGNAAGSVSGSVVSGDTQPVFGALVTLSDRSEQALAQSLTQNDGRFRFPNLPEGFYWVTARREGSREDLSVFRHVELTTSEPAGSVQLVMLRPDLHRPEQLQHKPVLIRVLDSNDRPLSDVALDSTWSSGTVLDNVKGQTGTDGTAVLKLIPGRNYLSLKRKGCPKQDERIDVAPGTGIDGFKLVFACTKR